LTREEIESIRGSALRGESIPRDLKVDLAKQIVTDFSSSEAADQAEAEFVRRFRNRETPEEVEEKHLPSNDPKGWDLSHLLVTVGLAESKAEARRLIQQGGVYVDGERQVTVNSISLWKPGITTLLLKVGKRRFVRVKFD